MKSQATSRDTAAARLQGEPNHRSTRDSRTHQPKRRGGTHTLKYSTENTRGDGDGSGSVGAGVHPRRSGRSGGREKFTQKITRTRLLSSHLFAGRQAGSRREVGERGRREERDVFSLFFRPGSLARLWCETGFNFQSGSESAFIHFLCGKRSGTFVLRCRPGPSVWFALLDFPQLTWA